MDPLSRRRFLKISSATIAAASAAACGRSSLTSGLAGAQERGVRKVATFCDVCFWKCGAIAYVKDGRLW